MTTPGEGARVTVPCEDCGGVLDLDVGQSVQDGRLRWDAEGACRSCPNLYATGGWDETPEWLRDELLAGHGAARLSVAEGVPSLLPVLKAVRELWNVPLPRAKALADELLGSGWYGTRAEMELAALGLRAHGVAVTVGAADDHGTHCTRVRR
jgi:hypothetical protein